LVKNADKITEPVKKELVGGARALPSENGDAGGARAAPPKKKK